MKALKRGWTLGILTLTACLLSEAKELSASSGGIGSSGGGHAVVCRNGDGSIKSAELLDIYEARRNGIKLRDAVGDELGEFKIYVEYLRHAGNDSRPVSADDLLEYTEDQRKFYNFVDADRPLPSTGDTGAHHPVPTGCAMEQLAVYHDDVHKIDVSLEIFTRLDSLNRVALFAHESNYFLYRRSGDVTSTLTRKVIATLFAQDLPQQEEEGVPMGVAKRCFSRSKNDAFQAMFYLYPNTEYDGQTVLQFTNLFGRITLSPVRIYLDRMIRQSSYKIQFTEEGEQILRVIDQDANINERFKLNSGIFAGYSIDVVFQYNNPFSVNFISPEGKTLHQQKVEMCFDTRDH